jgi:formate dehydrogenase assembly factor FdhD
MAIELAQQYGITLIGYARRASFNVYTHPGRLEGAQSSCSTTLHKL